MPFLQARIAEVTPDIFLSLVFLINIQQKVLHPSITPFSLPRFLSTSILLTFIKHKSSHVAHHRKSFNNFPMCLKLTSKLLIPMAFMAKLRPQHPIDTQRHAHPAVHLRSSHVVSFQCVNHIRALLCFRVFWTRCSVC